MKDWKREPGGGVGYSEGRAHRRVGGASEDFLTLINVTKYFLDDAKLLYMSHKFSV